MPVAPAPTPSASADDAPSADTPGDAPAGGIRRQPQKAVPDEERRAEWQRHWMTPRFAAIEALLASSKHTGAFCHGDAPTLADLCLIPQMYNARRVDLDMTPYPTLLRIEATALAHSAFIAAHPSSQPDAE